MADLDRLTSLDRKKPPAPRDEGKTELELVECEDIGKHYALMLEAWRRRFCDARSQITSMT